MHLGKSVLAWTLVLVMVSSTGIISMSASGEKVTYESYIVGNADDVETPTTPGLLLAGGDSDVSAGMKWMASRSGGGDFVVIRCSGTDAYNTWIYRHIGGVDSCETIIFLSDEACEDPVVINKIKGAEALFIAGGNQWDYVRMWKGTSIEDAINYVANVKHAPVGGTSAGLAVLGEFAFSAEKSTIDSFCALMNPYAPRVTIEGDFLQMAYMGDTITDSHFAARDRMGRLVTFMARIVEDGKAETAMGIGIEEKTALGVDENGHITLFGLGSASAAYFLKTPGLPETCEPGVPLTFMDIPVYKIMSGGTFDLTKWTGDGGTSYTLSAVDGVLESSLPDGSIY